MTLTMLATRSVLSYDAIFSIEQRESIVRWWQQDNRYQIELASMDAIKGPFAARLNTNASIWFLSYTKFVGGSRKLPPTQIALGLDRGETKGWEAWLTARTKYDWAIAKAEAQRRNNLLLSPPQDGLVDETKKSQTKRQKQQIQSPIVIPPAPGSAPQSLIDALGPPPIIATVVSPNKHIVHFDSTGTLATDTVELIDNVQVPERYAYYRFQNGVNSLAQPGLAPDNERIKLIFAEAGLSDIALKAFTAISHLEGSFESSQTYDTGFVSIGFIQFTSGQKGNGTLINTLQDEKTNAPEAYNQDFQRYGIDITPDGLITVIDPKSGGELTGVSAVKCIVEEPRLVAVFVNAGRNSAAWKAAQVRSAYKNYWPMEDEITLHLGGDKLTCLVSDIISSEAGAATLLDRKVNTGNISEFGEVTSRIARAHGATTIGEIRPYEREIIAALRYRVDYLNSKDLTQPPGAPNNEGDPNNPPGIRSTSTRKTESLPSRSSKPRGGRKVP